MNYWKQKEEKSKLAVTHTENMATKYKKEISDSIKNSRIYSDGFFYKKQAKIIPCINITMNDVCKEISIQATSSSKVAALNFASYKNPGGMFLKGSSAQEESLCHKSFLYNVLSSQNEYYEFNSKRLNKALYTNRALYTPNVVFEVVPDKISVVDIITCAAPNFTAAAKYCNVDWEENETIFKDRIKFMLDVADSQRVDILILGAWGCGVFGQKERETAELIKLVLSENDYSFSKIVFPNTDKNTFNIFKDVFNV